MASQDAESSRAVKTVDAVAARTATHTRTGGTATAPSTEDVADALPVQNESCRGSVKESHLPVSSSASVRDTALRTVPSWRSEERRSSALSEGSRRRTPPPAAHSQDKPPTTFAEVSPHRSMLHHAAHHVPPNYHTTTDVTVEGEIKQQSGSDKRKNVRVNYGDSFDNDEVDETVSEEEYDIHSLGERLNDVVECSLRSVASVAQREEVHSTMGRAAFHIFKGNVGAGVFLLPTYYQDAGYGLGVVLFLLLGVLMIDCALALLYAKQKINRVEVRTYPAVVEYVLGRNLMHFTRFSLIFTQFGFCVVYIQYASSMFAALFNIQHMYEAFVVLSALVVTPMTFFSNRMGALAYASMIAAVFVAVVLAGVTAEEVKNLSTQGLAPGTAFFVPTMRVLVFISGHMFSLEGIGVVLPVENSMAPEDRRRFPSLVKWTLTSVVALYFVFGLLGYMAFGGALQTSVVLALPPSTMKRLLQVLLGLSLIFGYPIQYVPAIQLVDRALGINLRRNRKEAYLVRISLNIFFSVLAGSIGADTINVFASFLGAFTGVHLMITMPVLLALLTDRVVDSGRHNELSVSEYISLLFKLPDDVAERRWYFYLLFAMIVWVGGTYYTFASVFG
ncbi:putative amino acid tansporter [Trypanosoma grayi]|uniref:putative amino acid tansporter n=1 Tax=Trypanosoma grayi TaxID=71804 RepID=UPI0004F472E9|nr:putative amino acid tansporter [Trypanosoma grayi]KEG11644.1 putative amino acid tansporter [Trypanosoma grayi]